MFTGFGVHQTVHVDNEIAHVRLVNRGLGFAAPCVMGGGIVRKNANDIEAFNIRELNSGRIFQAATEYQVEQLLFRFLRLSPDD